VKKILKAIKNSYSDFEIIEKLNYKTYELIHFFIKSNKMMIMQYSLLSFTDTIPINNPEDSKQVEKINIPDIEKILGISGKKEVDFIFNSFIFNIFSNKKN
jgi:hypothetical protein